MNYPVITLEDIKNAIREVPDFPIPGIIFKDITTALKKPDYYNYLVDMLVSHYSGKGITKVVAIEARGFITGGALAARLNAGFVPVRKPGKLPADTYKKSYKLEYGENTIEIHQDALDKDDVVLIHDDLLATGGTVQATAELLKAFNLKKICISFLCELDVLKGRELLKGYDVHSLIHFDS
jgi:adenine phosphoribosyltransferase